MRKGFTEENSKEMEVALKVRVPRDFGGELERRVDEALADVMFDFGCEMIDVGVYRDVLGWEKGDGLDAWRRMVVDEIDLNYEVYDLSEPEKEALLDDVGMIDRLAKAMEIRMQRGDRNEYQALELVFERDFPDIFEGWRNGFYGEWLDGLKLKYPVYIDDGTLYIDTGEADDVEVYLGNDGKLYCRMPDEDEPRPLKERFEDVEEGDAFFYGNKGNISIADSDVSMSSDGPVDYFLIECADGDCCFGENFGAEVAAKVRAILESFAVADKELVNRLVDAQKRAGVPALDKGNNLEIGQ